MPALPRRLLLVLVASCWALAACGDTPADEPAAESTTTIPVVSEVGRRRPWDGMILPPDVGPLYQSAPTLAELGELAVLGAPNVAVVVPLVQANPASVPRQVPGRTPTDVALGELMDAAVQLELGVVVQLRVEVADDPSALPDPADEDRWFDQYTRLASHYAELAERHQAAMVVIGAVPADLAAQEDAWSTVIDAVRDRYGGALTFAVEPPDLGVVSFWDDVDVIGIDINFPPEADVPEPVAADLEKAWEPVLAEMTALAGRRGRPVVLTRVGFPGVERDTADPPEVEVDHQLSAYEALFTVANQTPAIEGVLVWRWGGEPSSHGDEASYSPEGRPAEVVLRRAWTTPLAEEAEGGPGSTGAVTGQGHQPSGSDGATGR